MKQGSAEGLNELTGKIVDCGLKIHKALGPGLLESVYEHCLFRELKKRGLATRRQVWMPIEYDGEILQAAYRLDLVVEDDVIIEVKSVETLTGIHRAQLLTYLKLSPCRVGLLMNFNVELFKNGLRRLVSQTP